MRKRVPSQRAMLAAAAATLLAACTDDAPPTAPSLGAEDPTAGAPAQQAPTGPSVFISSQVTARQRDLMGAPPLGSLARAPGPLKRGGSSADRCGVSAPLVRRRFTPVLLLLFAVSGCAALIYEVVWFQLLRFVPMQGMIAVDRADGFDIPRHHHFLLDKAQAYFKRELPIDHWQAFLSGPHL